MRYLPYNQNIDYIPNSYDIFILSEIVCGIPRVIFFYHS